MGKLPLLQKILNRKDSKDKRLVIISNGYYVGINFVLMVREGDENDITLTDVIYKQFIPYMQSDYPLEEVSNILKKYGVNMDEKYMLEGIMFIVFKKEL